MLHSRKYVYIRIVNTISFTMCYILVIVTFVENVTFSLQIRLHLHCKYILIRNIKMLHSHRKRYILVLNTFTFT